MPNKKTLQTFGYIWALVFLIAGYKINMNPILFIISACFAVSAVASPEVYFKSGIFQSWIKVGDFLGKINSKIIIFILFFFIFTPIGLILRVMGKDLLKKNLDKTAKSYFTPRKIQAGPMINQF